MKKLLLIIAMCGVMLVGCGQKGVSNPQVELSESEEIFIEGTHDTIIKINNSINEEDFDVAIYYIEELKKENPDGTNAASTVMFLQMYYDEILAGINYEEYVEKTKSLNNIYTESAIEDIIMEEEDFVKLNIYLAN